MIGCKAEPHYVERSWINGRMDECVSSEPAALSGRLRMPGDKSISQRIALLCAWAEGESVIDGYLDGEDARSTLQAMEALGARSWIDDQNRLHIQGVAGQLKPTEAALDLGNSGTGTRLLAGLSRVVAYLLLL